MDNHIHMIASHPTDLTGVIRNFKSYTAKKLLHRLRSDNRGWILKLMSNFKADYKSESTYQFWEEGNHPKQIQNVIMYNQKVEYIHYNPVRRGLVSNEEDWVYSSARNFLGLESVYQVDELK